jgi:hypothetical protein
MPHVEADRPPSFDQVVELPWNRVTRVQGDAAQRGAAPRRQARPDQRAADTAVSSRAHEARSIRCPDNGAIVISNFWPGAAADG